VLVVGIIWWVLIASIPGAIGWMILKSERY
jgi:hypothetical protein